MLDLNAPGRTVLGVDLAPDTVDPLLFHAFPAAPTVAAAGPPVGSLSGPSTGSGNSSSGSGNSSSGSGNSSSGSGPISSTGPPAVQLLRFVSDGALTGGHLHLEVSLAHPTGRLEEVAATLTAERAQAGRLGAGESVRVSPVAVDQAAASLIFLGREANDQGGLTPLLARPYAEVAARLDPPHTAAFAVDLTSDGVRMITDALTSGQAPVAVVYRLRVEGLWPAQRVTARVDWGRVYDHVSSHLKSGWLLGTDDIARLTEDLLEDRSIVISAVQSLAPELGGTPADLDGATAWIQRELVERFCEPVLPLSRTPARASLGTVGEIFGVGTQFVAKRLTQVERAVATVDFSRSSVVIRNYTLQTHLADLVAGADPAGLIVDADRDHPFFARFALTVRAAAPLVELGLTEVVGELGYGTAALPIRLTPETATAAVDTWADASPDRTWALALTARFAPDAPVHPGGSQLLPPLTGTGRELTLDLAELLGVTEVALSQSSDPRVLFSLATVRQWRTSADGSVTLVTSRDLTLTADTTTGTVWFGDRRPVDRLDVVVKHLLVDGRLLTADPLPIDSSQVVLPPAYPAALTVQLVATDDWAVDGVRQVAVSLQRGPEAPALPVVLEAPGALATAALELPDPLDRSYRYRTTRTLVDGRVVEDDWITTDRPVLLVGGAGGRLLVVDLAPVGLELPIAGVLMVEVELSYLDPAHQIRDQRTLVIRALADRPRWEVSIADASRRGYEYRLIVHRTSGARDVGPWTPATDRLLPVPITPAPAPAPVPAGP